MNTSDRRVSSLASAVGQGVKRGWNQEWNSDSSLRRRRLIGLLIAFHGYCAGFVCVLSIVGALAGRNPRGNLEGALITSVIAFALIKVGRSARSSAIEP